MTDQEQKFDVFLSHNSQDKPAVEELAHRLDKEGIKVWLDKWNLIPGDPWQEAIEEALQQCRTCAVFVSPKGISPWENEEMRAAINRRVNSGRGRFRVVPVLLPGAVREERGRLPTFLVATIWVEFRNSLDDKEAFHRLVCGIKGIPPGKGYNKAIYEGQCPYRGLQFFDVEHSPFFFGREALTEWLINNLRLSTTQEKGNRFLAIIGSSGSGKSSLARAGLIAALKQGKIKGSENWPVVICRPGTEPLESLAVAFEQAGLLKTTSLTVFDLIDKLKDNERTLHIAIRSILNTKSNQYLVLLIDQFEELFTLCKNEELRQGLIDNLVYASSVAYGNTIVLLTFRADFYSKCAPYTSLAASLSDHQMLVGSMIEEEIQNVIERPAQLVGCEFEKGLIETLLHDVKDQPGSLPLLQHALLELWEQRQGNRLTKAIYQKIGGIEGSLEKRAEAVYSEFNEIEKQICRKLFLCLTQVGEGTEDTKRQATFKEIVAEEGEKEKIEAVILKLASPESRLVTTGSADEKKDNVAEVTHEALIHGWKRLREWLDEDREFLLWRQRLRASLGEWIRTNQDESVLLRGALLAEAESWFEKKRYELSEEEHKFIKKSADIQKKSQSIKKVGVMAAFVMSLVLAVIFGFLWKDANEQRKKVEEQKIRVEEQRRVAVEEKKRAEKQRKIALSRQLATMAQNQPNNKLDLSLLLSLEAQNTFSAIETIGSILNTIRHSPHLSCFLHGHKSPVNSVSFSPDGKKLASGSFDNTIILWDVETQKQIEQPLYEHKSKVFSKVFSVSFSPDGKKLASGSEDGTIILWDVETQKPIGMPLIGHKTIVMSVSFSQDGKMLASGSWDSTIILWDVKTQKPIGQPLYGHDKVVHSLSFNHDDTTLASGSWDQTILLWNMKTKKPIKRLYGHSHYIHSVSFSPDGNMLASGSRDNTIILWDLKTR